MLYKYFHIYKEWASSHFLIAEGIVWETAFLFPANCDPFHRFNSGSGYNCFSCYVWSSLSIPSLPAYFSLKHSHLQRTLHPSVLWAHPCTKYWLGLGYGAEADAVSATWVLKGHLIWRLVIEKGHFRGGFIHFQKHACNGGNNAYKHNRL